MIGVLATFKDVENRLANSIAGIREKFPDISNFKYSIDNPIALSLGLRTSEQSGIKEDGYYLDKKIVINSDILYLERKNFSLFHEISHYLISTDDEITSFLMQFHAGGEKEYQQYIESLCNLGAGEFLAPIDRITELIAEKEFSITLLEELDPIFPASKPAILFQLARTASHKCTLVVIDRRTPPRNSNQGFDEIQSTPLSKYQYFILYSATSKKNKYRPGRYTIVPKNHILRNAFEEQSFLKGSDFIPYRNGNQNHKCDCEAMYYHGKVYGLFNLEKPSENHLQPKLF